ncbi:MAG: hypothetical protein QHC89_28600 [Bosea sp. (in: a-proteobacteria)]|nr:hypothetical protein [Bosea sp. (in: a-proteobacteria)]
MTAMTKAERKECAANQQRLRERLTSLADQCEKAAADVKTLGDDMAAGIDGARAAALNRADDLRALELEAEAVERRLKAERDREEADRPFLEAEVAAEQKAARTKLCAEVSKIGAMGDEKARELKAVLVDFGAALDRAIAAGVDPHVKHQMLLQYVFEPMLVAAGFGTVRPEWAMIAPRSLETAAREQVRP